MTATTTELERLVAEYVALWNEREFSRLSEVVAESFALTSPAAGTVQGRDEVEAHARAVVDGFPDYRIATRETLVGDGVVVTESVFSGTHGGTFDGIPPTGGAFEVRGMVKFVVEDGELREERAYFDLYEVPGQLGIVTVCPSSDLPGPARSSAYRRRVRPDRGRESYARPALGTTAPGWGSPRR